MNITADWVMVIITTVYVIATIVICVFNYKSAKATREQVEESKRQFDESLKESNRQLDESKRQFNETNRPYVTCDYIYEQRAFNGIKICNHGKKIAENVSIIVDKKFIESLSNQNLKSLMLKLKDSKYTIGIQQSYEFYFASDNDEPTDGFPHLKVTVSYSDKTNKFSEDFEFPLNKYAEIQSLQSNEEKLMQEYKKINKNISNTNQQLSNIATILNKSNEDKTNV